MRTLSASILGVFSFFTASAVAHAAEAGLSPSMLGDGWMDAIAVSLLLSMGVGLAGITYKASQTA